MKCSEKQLTVISRLCSEISSWKNTNDINSPSHWTLIKEFCHNEMDDLLTEEEMSDLNYSLDIIMGIIKQVK